MRKILAVLFCLLTMTSCHYTQEIPVDEVLTAVSENHFRPSNRYSVEVIALGLNNLMTTRCNEIILKITDHQTARYEEYSFDTSRLGLKNGTEKIEIDLKSNEDPNVFIKGIMSWKPNFRPASTAHICIDGRECQTASSSLFGSVLNGHLTLIENDESVLKLRLNFGY